MSLLDSFRRKPIAAIDFESAGAERGQTDVPVQIGIATMGADGVFHSDQCFRSYLKSERPIVWSAQKIHGITDSDLLDAPSFVDLWQEVEKRLRNSIVVAHGVGTEKRFLRQFPLHGFGPWLDTVDWSRRVWPGLENYRLQTVIESLGLEPELRRFLPTLTWHDALFDAVASLLIVKKMLYEQD